MRRGRGISQRGLLAVPSLEQVIVEKPYEHGAHRQGANCAGECLSSRDPREESRPGAYCPAKQP